MQGPGLLSDDIFTVSTATRLLSAGLLAAALLAGCAQSATSVDTEKTELSESEIVARELEQSVGFLNDPGLLGYIESVGERIVEQGSRDEIEYRFYVLDTWVPNALALPEGQIFVSRGVLMLVNSEDELAGILAHEIAHVEERHANEREGLAIVTSPIRLGAGIAGWATGLIVPGLGEAIVELGASTEGLVLAPYSREQEREADRVGQSLAAAAGYAPEGLVDLLDTMANAEALSPQLASEPSFFDTHPATAERVALTRQYGGTLEAAPRPAAAMDRPGVLAMLQGLVVGEDPARGFFYGGTLVHPVLGFLMGFPRDWETFNLGGLWGAQAPGEDAFITLRMLGRSSDPLDGAAAASEYLGVDLTTEARRRLVNGMRAAKNQARISNADGEERMVEFTWIAHDDLVYQIMGEATVGRFEELELLMRASAHSFRALREEELDRIVVARLDVVAGQEGETIAELAERVGTPWTVDEIAVVNRRPTSSPLGDGELLKVKMWKRYTAERTRPTPYAPVTRDIY